MRRLKPGAGVGEALRILRKRIPASRKDEVLSGKMEKVREMILNGTFEGKD